MQRQGKFITYYALDLSSKELTSSLQKLAGDFPPERGITCHGLLGTYNDLAFWLAQQLKHLLSPVLFLSLGNSIGNFSSQDASAFLAQFTSTQTKRELRFIVGVDGCQDVRQIESCYEPSNPLTRAFLMNGLEQANEVLGFYFFRGQDWACVGLFDKVDRTWKDYYVAQRDLELKIAGTCIKIAKDERILAISSAKWTECDIRKISLEAGLRLSRSWRDTDKTYGNVPPLMVYPGSYETSIGVYLLLQGCRDSAKL